MKNADKSIRTMKSADNRPAWSSFETGYHRARRALAVVQRAGVVCLLALATVIVASRTAYGQGLPDSATPGSAIWTGDSMITWGGFKGNLPIVVDSGWSLNPITTVWTRLRTGAPLSPRIDHVAIWTGKEMILWGGDDAQGGYFSDGARYDLSSQSWKPISSILAPTGRQQAKAVWTGSRMLVFGGFNENLTAQFLADGHQYDPVADAWMPLSVFGAPSPRVAHSAAWTGEEMIVWGGYNGISLLNDGARYNPSTDTWQPTTVSNAPSPRVNFTAVWTGSEMIIWGGSGAGQVKLGDGARYNPTTDSWTSVSHQGAPTPRRSHTAVWTGMEMIVWGGSTGPGDGFQILNDGAAYNPATDTWRPLSNLGAPSVRYGHFAIWTGSQMLIWGGGKAVDEWTTATGGGAYDPVADMWTPITDTLNPAPQIISQPTNHFAVAGGPAAFNVVASGANPLNYQWFFGTNIISGATSSTYLLTNAQPANAGSYSVIVSNSYRTVTSLAAVLVVFSDSSNILPIEAQKYQSAVESEASLLSLYTFDNVTAQDIVGNASGALAGSATFGMGFAGGPDLSLALDGGGWVNVGAVPSLNFAGGSGTIDLWLKALWTNISYNPAIVASRNDSVSGVNYSIHMGKAKDRIYFWNGNAATYFSLPDNAGTNWHHLGIIFDHGAWTVVWDGVNLGTEVLSPTGSLAPVQLGSSNPGGIELWVGNLDDVAFYGTPLDPTNIYSHFIGTLSVSPPLIIQQPRDQSVAVDQPATLNVVVQGAKSLAYQWMFETNVVSGATNSTYSITNPLLSDSGSYSVVISNAFGAVTSTVARLTVQNFPTSVDLLPQTQGVQMGKSAQFQVRFGPTPWGGPLPPEALFTYDWRLDGHHILGVTGAYYSIPNIQFCDAGEYSVVVTDLRGGPSITVSGVLTVEPTSGQLSVQPQSQDIVVGQPATFSVPPLPGLNYQWRFGTNDIPGATGSSYTIPSVQFGDTGSYSAVLSSSCYGPATTSIATLTVTPGVPPSAIVQPTTQSIIAGHPASFSVNVQGSFPFNYQWRFGTNDIPGANDYSYMIDSVQPTNAGTYSVVVTNAFGVAISTPANLIVVPPGPLDIWTTASSGTAHWLLAVASSPKTVVVVGDLGTVVTSTNGVDWSTQASGVTNNLNAIEYGNGLFVAGGDAGTIISSVDGVFWTGQNSNTTNSIYGLTYGNGLFVGVGARGTILSSPDGLQWTRQKTSATDDLIHVAFGNGRYAAIIRSDIDVRFRQFSGSIALFLTNGIDGISLQDTGISSSALAFGAGHFFSVENDRVEHFEDSFPRYSISPDGFTWATGMVCSSDIPISIGNQGDGPTLTAAKVGNGQLVTVVETFEKAYGLPFEGDAALLSADLADAKGTSDPWSCGPFGFRQLVPENIGSIGFWRSRFVAVGQSGAIYLSGTLPPYLSQISQSGTTTSVRMEGIPLENYVLQSAAALSGPWQSISTNTTSADGIVTFTDPTPPDGRSRFYRVSGP